MRPHRRLCCRCARVPRAPSADQGDSRAPAWGRLR